MKHKTTPIHIGSFTFWFELDNLPYWFLFIIDIDNYQGDLCSIFALGFFKRVFRVKLNWWNAYSRYKLPCFEFKMKF